MKALYRVEGGIAEHCPPASTDVDGHTSILAYAEDDKEAERLAEMYDAGEIQPDNVTINGVTYGALRGKAAQHGQK